MQNSTRLAFLMSIALLLGACQRQPLPTAPPPVAEAAASEETTNMPTATTTPLPFPTRTDPTATATSTAAPSPTPLYCPGEAPAATVTTRPLRVFFVERGNLRMWDEATGATETLAEGGVYRLYLSPDADTIAFLRQEALGMIDASKQMVLWAVETNGENERLLIDGDNFRAMGPERVGDIEVEVVNPIRNEWLPRTQTLAFGLDIMGPSQCCGRAREVRLVDTATGGQRLLITTESDSIFTFSPDGRWMSLSDDSGIDLLELEDGATTGSRIENVVTYPSIGLGHAAYQAHPVWAKDGSEFSVALPVAKLFDDNAEPAFTVWEVPTTGGSARQLATITGFPLPVYPNIGSAIFSPDRSQIAFYRTPARRNEGKLLIADVAGEWQVVYDSGWGPRFLGWAPDANHFAYAVGQGRQRLLRIGRLCQPPFVFDGPPPAGDTPVTWVDDERFLYQSQSGNVGPTALLLGTLDGTVREIGQLSERMDSYNFIN